MVWDEGAQNLAYLAEKKVAKAKPFFNSNVKKDDEKMKDKKTDEKQVTQIWIEQVQA